MQIARSHIFTALLVFILLYQVVCSRSVLGSACLHGGAGESPAIGQRMGQRMGLTLSGERITDFNAQSANQPINKKAPPQVDGAFIKRRR